MRLQIPPPANWQDFETFCCDLWREIWQDPNTQKHGKPGQAQHGVDFYGRPDEGDAWAGVQCKGKDNYADKSLTEKEVETEVNKALHFTPKLSKFIIATTGPKDAKIQKLAREITDKHRDKGLFSVHVWGWEDIVNRAKGLPNIVERYPWISPSIHVLNKRILDEVRDRIQEVRQNIIFEDTKIFSQQWFEYRLEEALENAGPRYTPELNVELPIARIFDGLGRTPVFFQRLKALSGKIKKAYSITQRQESQERVEQANHVLYEYVPELLSQLGQIDHIEQEWIDFESIEKCATQAEQLARTCYEEIGRQKRAKTESFEGQQEKNEYSHQKRRLEDIQQDFYALFRALHDLRDFIGTHEAQLSNVSALLLTGDAGTGKTHLFCDIAQQRIRNGLPTVLLLGEEFSNREPWTQISELLGISCKKEAFLGALEAAAQARGERALLLIDALNEGEGKYLWQKHLAGMLKTLSRYPWISFAISVRTSYETLVVPSGLVPERLIQHVHYGFAEHEYKAMRTFFEYFHLERPTIPLLLPEFQKPLFLKWFCLGLYNKGLTKIPRGLRGITAIFDFFIESVSEKLYRSGKLDFDPASRIFQKAVEKLAQLMAGQGKKWLPREEAQTAVNTFLPSHGYENSLFRHMLTEGILAERRFPVGKPTAWQEGIQFAYERFTDHLIARYLLDKHLDIEHPSDSFLPGQPLGEFFKDQHTCLMNSGLIEAFSIQLPERIHTELPELVPHCTEFQTVRKAFVESLVWRNPACISEAATQYINEHVLQYHDTHTQFYNALLTITSHPEHPYNADFLHKNLLRYELARRDAWWSLFLCHQYGTHGAVDRLVDWAWSEEDKSHIDDESIRLCGMALAWFLTTSQRHLRDKATKALVALLTPRIHVLRHILAEFITVNDPYILERLFAVAYGCALRSTDNEALGELAQDVYERVFKDNTPPPHILLRDYARGVIEYALIQGIDLNIDIENVRPPYTSEWSSDVPTDGELLKKSAHKELSVDESRAQSYLFYSVMEYGDFARYIIGTNDGHFPWSNRRLDAPDQLSRKEVKQHFIESLTERQRKAWEQYETVRENVQLYRRLNQAERIEAFTQKFTEEELQLAINDTEKVFRRTLGKKKLLIFEEHILPDLTYPFRRGLAGTDNEYFDLQIVQRWILNKVFELGWLAERFGRFDRWIQIDLYGHPEQPERIGKKYQWIAYHEFLARVSDNFELHHDFETKQPVKYNGPWQTSVRDIDPSFVLHQTQRKFLKPYPQTWWFPTAYESWENEPDDTTWLKCSDDLPALDSLIEVRNPADNSRWFVLEAFYPWEQAPPSEEERYSVPRREIRYSLTSYIVRNSDMEELFIWAQEQDFFHKEMPESYDVFDVFFGELFGMPAFSDLDPYPHDGWINETRWGEKLPKEIVGTVNRYLSSFSGNDCSISNEDIFNIYIPSKWLAEQMELRWNGVEGHFFDAQGNLIAFDPSVRTPGIGTLLINRDAFLRFLNNNGYDILWIMRGEKRILTISLDDRKGRQELSGAYRVLDGKIQGAMKTKFIL